MDEINSVLELMEHISHSPEDKHTVKRLRTKEGMDWLVIELECSQFGGQYWFWLDGTVMQVL